MGLRRWLCEGLGILPASFKVRGRVGGMDGAEEAVVRGARLPAGLLQGEGQGGGDGRG